MGKSKVDNRYGNEKKRNQISAGKGKAIGQEDECSSGSENESGKFSDLEQSLEGNVIGEATELQESEGFKVKTAGSFSTGRHRANPGVQAARGGKGKRKAADAYDSDGTPAIERQKGSSHGRVRQAGRGRGRGRVD
jgi:hypothetical protein